MPLRERLAMSEIIIEDVKRLVLGPNEHLVVTLPADAKAQEFHAVSEALKKHFPAGRVLVVTKNVELSVVAVEE